MTVDAHVLPAYYSVGGGGEEGEEGACRGVDKHAGCRAKPFCLVDDKEAFSSLKVLVKLRGHNLSPFTLTAINFHWPLRYRQRDMIICVRVCVSVCECRQGERGRQFRTKVSY